MPLWCLEQFQSFFSRRWGFPGMQQNCIHATSFSSDGKMMRFLSFFSTETLFFMELLRTWYLQDLYDSVSFGQNRQKDSKVIIVEKGVKQGL